MDIFSILFGLFEEKDGEKILKIIGILFQYLFNISVPSIVLCIQCKADVHAPMQKTQTGKVGKHDGRTSLEALARPNIVDSHSRDRQQAGTCGRGQYPEALAAEPHVSIVILHIPNRNMTTEDPEMSGIGRTTENMGSVSANQVLLAIKYIGIGTERSEILS